MQIDTSVCLYRLDSVAGLNLPGFVIAASFDAIEDALHAIESRDLAALVLDLDHPESVSLIVEALARRPRLAVVGVTARTSINELLEAQRAGCMQFTMKPIDPNDLAVALRRAMNVPSAQVTESRTFALMGAIGGAGATTIACHLGVELAELRKDAAVVDLDLEFGGVVGMFDVSAPYTIADLVSVGAADTVLLNKAAVQLPSGLHLFARPANIAAAHAMDESLLRPTLSTLGKHYKVLVLDLPRRLDPIVGTAIEMSDKLIVVLQLTVPAIENTRRLIEALEAEGIKREQIELVVNRHRKNMHTCTVEMVEQQLKRSIFGVVPSDYQSVQASGDLGKPLTRKNPVRQAIAEIAQKLLGDTATQAPKAEGAGGWLKNLTRLRGSRAESASSPR